LRPDPAGAGFQVDFDPKNGKKAKNLAPSGLLNHQKPDTNNSFLPKWGLVNSPLEMDGGTTFYFVTEGIHKALELAKEKANGKDVRVGGGAFTIRQYLQAGLIDEIHLAVSPVLLGAGESLLEGINLKSLGFHVAQHVSTSKAMHVVLSKA
jgi:hypothetical protein